MNTEKICTLSVDHAIKISKVIATAPVERMPMITQLFHQAAVDLEGLDELIATSSISKQGALIDTIAFLEELTAGRELSEQGNLFTTEEFNQFCIARSLQPRLVRRHLCSRTRFLRISDNENENFIGKSRKEFLAPLTRTDDP